MARLHLDGAEMGDILFWDTAGSVAIEGTIKRTGDYSYKLGISECYKNVTLIGEFYFRIAIYTTNFGGSAVFCQWRNGTTKLGGLQFNSGTSCVDIQRGNTAVGFGAVPLSLNTWHLIEVWVDIGNSPNGNFTVKIDGVTDATFLNGDTQPGADTQIDNIGFAQIAGITYIDDFAFDDAAYPGDGHIILLSPNGNGDLSQLTNTAGNSTNNYSYVDEIPPDDDTSYVEGVSAVRDLYALEDFAVTSVTILNAYVEGRARDTVAAGGICKLIIKTGGVEFDSANISLQTAYNRIVGTIYTVNPDTTVAWTDGDLDALQAGFKVP